MTEESKGEAAEAALLEAANRAAASSSAARSKAPALRPFKAPEQESAGFRL